MVAGGVIVTFKRSSTSVPLMYFIAIAHVLTGSLQRHFATVHLYVGKIVNYIIIKIHSEIPDSLLIFDMISN